MSTIMWSLEDGAPAALLPLAHSHEDAARLFSRAKS